MVDVDHHIFTAPPDETLIWRYMDFTKFVDLLERRTLFFSSAANFDDPFEGSVPVANPELLQERMRSMSVPQEVVERFSRLRKLWRRWMYVNCWHMNEHESAAMWKLYARTSEAIAIRSTFGALRACLPGDQSVNPCVYIGKVLYIDYAKAVMPEGNAFWPFIHKRLSFEHERELRAVMLKSPPTRGEGKGFNLEAPAPPGMAMPVDVERLVNHIFVAPSAPTWFRELVENVLARYSLKKPVDQSSLDAKPIF
jgi:hypothetical protein